MENSRRLLEQYNAVQESACQAIYEHIAKKGVGALDNYSFHKDYTLVSVVGIIEGNSTAYELRVLPGNANTLDEDLSDLYEDLIFEEMDFINLVNILEYLENK